MERIRFLTERVSFLVDQNDGLEEQVRYVEQEKVQLKAELAKYKKYAKLIEEAAECL